MNGSIKDLYVGYLTKDNIATYIYKDKKYIYLDEIYRSTGLSLCVTKYKIVNKEFTYIDTDFNNNTNNAEIKLKYIQGLRK